MKPFSRHRINQKVQSVESTGFGAYSKDNTGRFYDKNGLPNVHISGLGVWESFSWYHTLINMPNYLFFIWVFMAFVFINFVFTAIYALIGIDHLAGIQKGSDFQNFMEMFFFSTQTFTTVGYGRISPLGMLTSGVATFEAFLGLLSFALATGLFYGRFSRPKAHLKFSKNVLITPFKEGKALMFRMTPFKKNYLTEVEVKLTLAIRVEEDGVLRNKFYILDTEISRINTLTLSWTVVHDLNEKSPLFHFTNEEILASSLELLVFVRGFDEAYSNVVVARTSYVNTEFVPNAKFKIMYGPDNKINATRLDFKLLDEYDSLT